MVCSRNRAFAPGDQLDGDYVNAATREGYRIAHDISAYSFVAMAQAARPSLNPNAALLTLSCLGSEQRQFLTSVTYYVPGESLS